MKFTILATVLTFVALAIASPIPVADDVSARQNHGMCVSAVDGGDPVQIDGC
ncbi:hypothetical protein GQ43DRAFT_441012 [Delitschia confertaspora ATCC 74209]|uniref:Uncharacterized protein n=1 Tax=Delitschia confertaspora ATCC 74209 TaxID=1513339 RepID=A0A9P4JMK2_9PLEO|nr:hypothetical protein GQ43DRAFT_441012 [Delitschia confertaspora ATCC 74209]